MAQKLMGRKLSERLVRADGAVDLLPLTQFVIELVHFQRADRGLIKPPARKLQPQSQNFLSK